MPRENAPLLTLLRPVKAIFRFYQYLGQQHNQFPASRVNW